MLINIRHRFTLIEVIATIVISGFVGSMLIMFLNNPIESNYEQTVNLQTSYVLKSISERIYTEYQSLSKIDEETALEELEDYVLKNDFTKDNVLKAIIDGVNNLVITISVDYHSYSYLTDDKAVTFNEVTSPKKGNKYALKVTINVTAPTNRTFSLQSWYYGSYGKAN